MKVVAIVGKSASGKSTIINGLVENSPSEYNVIKSYTTREVRMEDPNDINTHVFVDNKFWQENKHKAIAVYHSPKGYISWVGIELFEKDKINLYAIDPNAVTNELYPHCRENGWLFDCLYIECDESMRIDRYLKREGNLDRYSEEEHLDKKYLNGVPYYVIYSDSNYDTNIIKSEACMDWIQEDWRRINYNSRRGVV